VEHFVDMHINLTGCDVDRCLFDGCAVELWRGQKSGLSNTEFKNCHVKGDGWPERLLQAARRADGDRFTFSS
jgi:hypothetical protein